MMSSTTRGSIWAINALVWTFTTTVWTYRAIKDNSVECLILATVSLFCLVMATYVSYRCFAEDKS